MTPINDAGRMTMLADRLKEIFALFIVSSLRKTRQQGIRAGGVPMHYSNAAAAALE